MTSTSTKPKQPQARRRGEEVAVERIEMRVAPKDKRKIVLAARQYGESASSFLMQAALNEIERRKQQRELLKLSARDQHTFVQALLGPPKVNNALLASAREYREEFTPEQAGS